LPVEGGQQREEEAVIPEPSHVILPEESQEAVGQPDHLFIDDEFQPIWSAQ